MKVQSITIGEYQISPAIPFNLYQFSSSLVTPPIHDQEDQEYSINYFCIEDLFAIFDLDLIKIDLIHTFKQYPGSYCKNGLNNHSYIQTQVIGDIALKHQLYNLTDLCRLSINDLLSGGAIPLLKMTTFIRLFNKPMKSIIDNFQTRQLEGNEWFFTSSQNMVKLEPFSPRLICLSSSSSSSSAFIHQNQETMIHEDIQPQEDNLINKLPKPSSLLLKRLAPKHGHKKNLTILTPSYNEDSPMNGIQSAPLRRTTTIPVFGNKSKVVKKSSPPNQIIKKSRLFNNIPATASAISAPWPQTSAQTRFPSPPIVPSQQPSWAQYRQQQQQQQNGLKTGTFIPRTPTITKTNTSPQPQPQPPTQTQHLTQKQKFLQPFEFLYDHIEQTRVLKTTLDDQIRRSSSLMQTLQSSGTMVESLVRRQVRDMMDEKFEAKIRDCTERISKLEYRYLPTSNTPISPAISPTKEQQQKPLVVKDLLSQLMNRIDQLESKLEK